MDRYVEGYIDQTRVIRALLLDIVADYKRASEEKMRLFLDPLEMWVYELFRRPLPHDWRDRLADFLAYWEEDKGYTLTPESTRILYAAIEMLAKRRGLLPAGADHGSRSKRAARPSVVKAPVAVQRPSEPVVAPIKSPPPSDWPKTSPEQRAQNRANAELAGWQSSLPAHPEDPKWEHRFESYGRIARDRLLKFFQALAVEGRIARDIGDPKRADLEPLFVQQQWVEQAYFGYLQARIDIYCEWTRYLRLGRFAIGVSILALLEKIERELFPRIEGIGSPRESSLNKARQESFEAFEKAQASLERADAALVWTDRAIVPVVTLAGTVRQAAQRACAAALAEGLSPTAAHKIGLAAAMSHAAASEMAGAADSLVVVGDLIPPALQDAGLDEREIRAGLAVFLTIATLRDVTSLHELDSTPELPYNRKRSPDASTGRPSGQDSKALAAGGAERPVGSRAATATGLKAHGSFKVKVDSDPDQKGWFNTTITIFWYPDPNPEAYCDRVTLRQTARTQQTWLGFETDTGVRRDPTVQMGINTDWVRTAPLEGIRPTEGFVGQRPDYAKILDATGLDSNWWGREPFYLFQTFEIIAYCDAGPKYGGSKHEILDAVTIKIHSYRNYKWIYINGGEESFRIMRDGAPANSVRTVGPLAPRKPSQDWMDAWDDGTFYW